MKVLRKRESLLIGFFSVWVSLGSFIAEVQAQETAAGGSGGTMQLILGTVQFVAIGFFVYYMLVILPRNTQETEHKKFLSNLKKGDEIVTTGGLLGKVSQLREDVITVELSSSVKVRVLPSHIQSRSSTKSNDEAAKAKTANTN